MEVHTAYDNHTDGNDDGDAAGDCAANGAKKQQELTMYNITLNCNVLIGCTDGGPLAHA